MAGNVPGILPKAALVGARTAYYPFALPKKVVDTSYVTGRTLEAATGGVINSIGSAYASLDPKGPAKWLLPMFDRLGSSIERSQRIADRNMSVFWAPLTQGIEGVGRAVTGLGTLPYLKRIGVEPTQDAISGILNMKLFEFPAGAPPAPSDAGQVSLPDDGPGDVATSDAGATDAGEPSAPNGNHGAVAPDAA